MSAAPADRRTETAPRRGARPCRRRGRRRARRRRRIFGDGRFLVAYYGTAGTGALGVLGETAPDAMPPAAARAAARRSRARPAGAAGLRADRHRRRPLARAGRRLSHDVPEPRCEQLHRRRPPPRRAAAARPPARRSGFLDVARRWEWALRDRGSGWRSTPSGGWAAAGARQADGQRGRRRGQPAAPGSRGWRARHACPQKLFVLHQFRTDMIRDISAVAAAARAWRWCSTSTASAPRDRSCATYRRRRPARSSSGWASSSSTTRTSTGCGSTEVHRLRPKVRFVSFQ